MRRQPVAFALIDAAFLADSKFRGLRRRLPEPRDFNSAVGAWLIVLTSARRNGLPQVDAADEAEDSTYLPDLIAVGLLTEEGIPEGPFKAWAPARPKYPSDMAHLVTLCEQHHLWTGWATAHRPELREYLRSVNGEDVQVDPYPASLL